MGRSRFSGLLARLGVVTFLMTALLVPFSAKMWEQTSPHAPRTVLMSPVEGKTDDASESVHEFSPLVPLLLAGQVVTGDLLPKPQSAKLKREPAQFLQSEVHLRSLPPPPRSASFES